MVVDGGVLKGISFALEERYIIGRRRNIIVFWSWDSYYTDEVIFVSWAIFDLP